eukprot:7685455-Alexandrium_andersonii.AAC.1
MGGCAEYIGWWVKRRTSWALTGVLLPPLNPIAWGSTAPDTPHCVQGALVASSVFGTRVGSSPLARKRFRSSY